MKARAYSLTELLVTLMVITIIVLAAGHFFLPAIMGTFPFGPVQTKEVTVNRLYVDYSGGKDSQRSHYMVGTDVGVYEVNNSWWLGIWNADELYSKLQQGKRYRISSKGNQVLNMFVQKYPGITKIEDGSDDQRPVSGTHENP